MTRHTVLLLGNYRPALSVARTLSAAGHRVIVSRDQDAGAASRSRAVAELWDSPDTDDPVAVCRALAGYLDDHPDITAVFPLMESYVRAVQAHGDMLPQDRLWVMANGAAVDVCLDKARLLQTVYAAGLPCARSLSADDMDGLRAAVDDIGFPLVVKPSDSTVWLGTRKALILTDQAGFQAALPDWPAGHDRLIVQTYVDGPRINLYFVAAQGQALRYLPVEIGQTDIADGTGLATTGCSVGLDDGLRQMGDQLIAQLGYHGVGCMQFLRDAASGQLSFLEINPRIGGNHAITRHAGLDLELLALDLAAGETVEPGLKVGRAGIRYAWTTGALRGVGLALRNRELTLPHAVMAACAALWTGATTRRHITFALSDPLPSLTLLSRLLRR